MERRRLGTPEPDPRQPSGLVDGEVVDVDAGGLVSVKPGNSPALVGAAAFVDMDNGTCRSLRVVVGAAAATPQEFPETEKLAAGQKLDIVDDLLALGAQQLAAGLRGGQDRARTGAVDPGTTAHQRQHPSDHGVPSLDFMSERRRSPSTDSPRAGS